MKIETRNLTDIIDTEFREFSMYTIENRAIPSVIDGLKPTQRKLLYAMLTEYKGNKVKVAELGGGLAKLNYHHGEGSAQGAAVGMAQAWSNNAPIFDGHGNFGSRLVQEAAAARYIFASLSNNYKKYFLDIEVCPKAFDPENPEPAFYLPIIPWVLVNGISGIAVGFKTEILPRSIADLASATKECVKRPESFLAANKPITPTFPNFRGGVTQIAPNQWKTNGLIEYSGKNIFTITELPIGYDRASYVELLNSLLDKDMIKDYDDQCSKDGFGFTVKVSLQQKIDIEKDPFKYFKLERTHTEILTTLGHDGKLKIFDSVAELIHYFVTYRLTKFDDKIEYDKSKLNDELAIIRHKIKFIEHVIDDSIDFRKTTKDLLLKFINDNVSTADWAKSFIHIPLYECTKDQVESLKSQCIDKEQKLKVLGELTAQQLYLTSLKL